MAYAETGDMMRASTVRAPEWMWEALEAESARSGQSAAEQIRQGIALWLVLVAAQRSTDDLRELLPAMLLELRRR